MMRLALTVLAMLLLTTAAAAQCVPLGTIGAAYTQDFNTLATSGTTNTALPTGWYLYETGTNANVYYRADAGTGTTGDTYSYGAAGSTDRAFGTLLSGSLTPTIGACFTNNTGAIAGVFGVEPEVAAARLADVDVVDGRYAELDLGGRPARLFLAKNPAGWAAALAMIEPGAQLMVGINARIADGTDTSWLYDVPFERLEGRVVGAIGDRRDDLAVRLHYAGATPVVDADPVALAAALPPGPLVVAANYTAFRELRRHVPVA